MFNKKILNKASPLSKILPISNSAEETQFRTHLFNTIDKSKFGYISMQNVVDVLSKDKNYEVLLRDLSVWENAYRVIKMLQMNS